METFVAEDYVFWIMMIFNQRVLFQGVCIIIIDVRSGNGGCPGMVVRSLQNCFLSISVH